MILSPNGISELVNLSPNKILDVSNVSPNRISGVNDLSPNRISKDRTSDVWDSGSVSMSEIARYDIHGSDAWNVAA